MVKFIVVCVAAAIFIYCTNLSFQGNLDMATVVADVEAATRYIKHIAASF